MCVPKTMPHQGQDKGRRPVHIGSGWSRHSTCLRTAGLCTEGVDGHRAHVRGPRLRTGGEHGQGKDADTTSRYLCDKQGPRSMTSQVDWQQSQALRKEMSLSGTSCKRVHTPNSCPPRKRPAMLWTLPHHQLSLTGTSYLGRPPTKVPLASCPSFPRL